MTVDDLLKSTYVKHGREWPELDCYGLVRLGRAGLFGRELLPSYSDIDPMDKPSLTDAAVTLREGAGFTEVGLCAGAIATAWRARLCVHVGLVVEADGRLWILETDENTGPTLTRINKFEARYTRVVFYDN